MPKLVVVPSLAESAVTVVSYSELDAFRQCPLKHFLTYKQRWTKGVVEGGALDKGTQWHLVLEAHYGVIRTFQQDVLRQLGVSEAYGPTKAQLREVLRQQRKAEQQLLDACELAVTPLLSGPDGKRSEVQELLVWMYEGYVERWGADCDWFIVDIENKETLPLRDRDGVETRYHLKVRIDLIVWDRVTGRYWIVDHKSAADLAQKKDLELDDQFGLYTWLMRVGLGMDIQGSIHNGARTKLLKRAMTLDERYARTPMFRSPVELLNIALDALRVAEAAGDMDQPYSSPNPGQCGWKCDVREPHLALRKGIARGNIPVIMKDFGFHQDFTRH